MQNILLQGVLQLDLELESRPNKSTEHVLHHTSIIELYCSAVSMNLQKIKGQVTESLKINNKIINNTWVYSKNGNGPGLDHGFHPHLRPIILKYSSHLVPTGNMLYSLSLSHSEGEPTRYLIIPDQFICFIPLKLNLL